MKAAIYNPYLDSLGGGERYSMAVAQILSEAGYKVDVEWRDQKIKKSLESRFGINLNNINFVENVKNGDSYDLCFWVSDGSIPTLKARNNILHFQVPFHDVNGKTLINKMKFFRIKSIVCNSIFTKEFVDREYGIESRVIYPPVSVEKIRPGKKEKVILSVGRFSNLERSKRQDVLVESFKKLYDKGNREWKLVLAGGTDVGVGDFVKTLREKSQTYPIRIIENPSFKELSELYKTSKIFWFASGFGVDELKKPELAEHFGIVVVESMAAGMVPVVFNAGGHKEIIQDKVNGILWTTKDELVEVTENIINNEKLCAKLISQAKLDSSKYSYERFKQELLAII